MYSPDYCKYKLVSSNKLDYIMKNDDINAQQLVLDEINKLPGFKKTLGDTIQVCCPFHDDKSPSCGIYVAMGMEIPFGFFNCFGCGEKGPWNKLAKHVGLQEIEGWKFVESDGVNLAQLYRKNEEVIKTNFETKRELLNSLGRISLYPWGAKNEWRGVPGQLVRDCEGMYHVDNGNDINCFFPVAIGKKYKGGIKAYLEKQPNKSSYVNTSGKWIQKYGLFPYNLIRENIVKYKLDYVILTEGPRDPLRLIVDGLPALAILGGNNFSKTKLDLVIALGVSTIYVMSDNDKGGRKMRKNIKEVCKGSAVKLKMLRLPEEKDRKGELIKMDPENAPKEIIREVRKVIKTNHKTMPRKYKRRRS